MGRTYSGAASAERFIADAHNRTRPDVKAPSERYSDVRFTAKHRKTGLPVLDHRGREIETQSQRDLAKMGAFMKFKAARSGVAIALTDHENGLMEEMFARDTWVVTTGETVEKNVPGSRVKTLLYDSTSGGTNAVPLWFDDDLITFPLLYGEIAPYVRLVEVPRGATVGGASLANPTIQWGSAVQEGTSITTFNTASMVAPVNSSIHVAAVAVQVGRDFLADATPIEVGTDLVGNMSQALANSLDSQLANGDGTNEPLGIFNTSGTAVITTINGSSGALTVHDVEAMLFGLPRQYRKPNNPSIRWVMNDGTYRRIRGISVSSTDQRRIFGYNYEAYMLADRGVSIQNDIPTVNCAIADLSRYRLYRRDGTEVRVLQEGITLGLTNTVVFLLRARYGGRMVDGNAVAESNTFPNSG